MGKTSSMRKITLWLVISLILLGGLGCNANNSRAKPGAEFAGALRSEVGQSDDLLAVNTLAVLPLEFGNRTGTMSQHAADYYSVLRDAVSSELGLSIKADDQFFKKLNAKGTSEHLDDSLAQANSIGADSILRTVVHEYQERRGSSMAADQMAQFNFTMSVIRVRDGRVVWTSNYNFRDQAATDNLLRLGEQGSGAEKFGFSTASDSLAIALRTAVRDLSDRRAARFQGARG